MKELKHAYLPPSFSERIAKGLGLSDRAVKATLALLAEGATVPFIARYRKEHTDSLDEVAIAAIRDEHEALQKLEERRESILGSLQEREILTEALKENLLKVESLAELEDLYLPYKVKRRTRALIAREQGLLGLAESLLAQNKGLDPEKVALAYVKTEGENPVANVEAALQGARDIIAEMVSEHKEAREKIRELFLRRGQLESKVSAKADPEKKAHYRDYLDYQESVANIASHRLLALFRAEAEGYQFKFAAGGGCGGLSARAPLHHPPHPSTPHLKQAIKDGYKRL
ncbi:MAG: Tex-like N-terminal domain-containing protein [Deinococcales bacterium]